MINRDEPFQPELVDEQVKQLLAQAASRSPEPAQPGVCLIQDLRQVLADDTPSGARVWIRLAERVEERNTPAHALSMLPNRFFPRERNHSMSSSELNTMHAPVAEPPHGLRRVFALVAATIVMTILVGSTLWLFHAMRMPPQQTTTAQRGIVGIHTGKLLCHASYTTHLPYIEEQPPLSWSPGGMIAVVNPTLKIFAAQMCVVQSRINIQQIFVYPAWSPDGKRLLVLDGSTALVLDRATGKVLVSFQADPSYEFSQAVWVAGGTQIISSEVDVLTHTTQRVNIQVWNANSGALIHTALTFNSVSLEGPWISPTGQDAAVQRSDGKITFWNIGTGKLLSTTTSSVMAGPVAWSPDSAAFAVGEADPNWPAQPAKVQIWSSTTGHLLATFQDAATFQGNIGGLAWSPNGQELAESSAEIHLWNVSTGKLVATFGKALSGSEIVSVAWARDGSKLASATTTLPAGPHPTLQKTLEVWQLS